MLPPSEWIWFSCSADNCTTFYFGYTVLESECLQIIEAKTEKMCDINLKKKNETQ